LVAIGISLLGTFCLCTLVDCFYRKFKERNSGEDADIAFVENSAESLKTQ
jgi:hypothetical protein